MAEICAEEDLPILQHLVKVENEFDPNSLNFTIKFEFSNNDYFTDKVLEKKFIFEGTNGDNPIESTGSKINWKTGKNITKKIIKKVNIKLIIILEVTQQENRCLTISRRRSRYFELLLIL